MTAATLPEVIDEIRYEWAIAPNTSARQIARKFQDKYGTSLVRNRRIIKIVAEVKGEAPTEAFPCTLWKPWADPEKNSGDNLYLIQLHQLRRREGSKGLGCHEAAWARRLRQNLEGLEPLHRQLELVHAYTEREKVAYFLGESIQSEDLDGFVTFQMWRSTEHKQRYEEAVADGSVPVPFLGRSEAFIKELVTLGPEGIGEEVWNRLNRDPLFRYVFQLQTNPSDPLPAGWSDILLEILDEPPHYDSVLGPVPTNNGAKVAVG
jgi:hypothetical protein